MAWGRSAVVLAAAAALLSTGCPPGTDDDAGDDDGADDDAGDDDARAYDEEPPPAGDAPLPGESPPGQTESTVVDGFFDENFVSPEPWATMQNDDADCGVAIFYEHGVTAFQGWQLLSLPFNNVRAQFSFGLPASGTVHARAYLVLGSLGTVDAETQWLQDHLPPFGVMDAPSVGAEIAEGPLSVHGWTLDNRGVASVEAVIDETTHVPLGYGDARPDVCLAWPGYPGCDAVGYSGTIDLGPAQECPHLLEIVATDGDGNSRTMANTLVTVVP